MDNTQNKKNVVIIGAGGHAHVIADIITASGDEVIAYLDDNPQVAGRNGDISDYEKYKDAEFVIGIGNVDAREKIANNLNVKWYTAIHPSAIVSPSAVIGNGTVVMPNAVINARAVIGNHCIINTAAIVEHDNIISDFVHVSVGVNLGGTVFVGRNSWIGIGATIKNNINICDNCLIGAGSVIINDLIAQGTYIGVPAKKIR